VWPVPDEAVVQRAVRGGLFSYCAEKDGEAIGMARVIGDGAIYYYVQDVIVLPEYRKQAIGTLLMNAVMGEINSQTPTGGYIALFSAPGLQHFYARYGFVERPVGKLGPGMVYMKKRAEEDCAE